VLVSDGGQGAVITGDAAHHPGEFENPELNPPFDSDVAMARASRKALGDRVEAEGLLVIGGHFPSPGAGNLVRLEGRRRWRWA
jgi:glyoxylase-like metal-dependent hydrolase (beta-lactamase superfamily II)